MAMETFIAFALLVAKMAVVIKNLSQYQPKITLIPEVRQLITVIAGLEGFANEIKEEKIAQVIAKLKDRTFAAYLSATTRMTVSPNVVHGGVKTNIVPEHCEAQIDIRFLPGQDKEYIVGQLGQAIADTEMETIQYHAPTFSTSDSGYYQLLRDTMQESFGNAMILQPSVGFNPQRDPIK